MAGSSVVTVSVGVVSVEEPLGPLLVMFGTELSLIEKLMRVDKVFDCVSVQLMVMLWSVFSYMLKLFDEDVKYPSSMPG